jgi:hypothetical protein
LSDQSDNFLPAGRSDRADKEPFGAERFLGSIRDYPRSRFRGAHEPEASSLGQPAQHVFADLLDPVIPAWCPAAE